MRKAWFVATFVLAVSGSAAAADPTADPTAEALLNRVDDFARGESSHATLRMQVQTQRYSRTMEMESWSKGTDKSLIRILSPAKEAGVSTLMVDDNIWNYMPNVDRTLKIPPGMMSGAWMGSHISNDDLVKDSRLSEQFTYTITGRPEGPDGAWTIELVPKPDAPVVWGKVVAQVGADQQPRQVAYFDEKGALVRTMRFLDLVSFDGRTLPSRMRVEPADAPGEFTEITYLKLDFDIPVDDGTFSLQALRR